MGAPGAAGAVGERDTAPRAPVGMRTECTQEVGAQRTRRPEGLGCQGWCRALAREAQVEWPRRLGPAPKEGLGVEGQQRRSWEGRRAEQEQPAADSGTRPARREAGLWNLRGGPQGEPHVLRGGEGPGRPLQAALPSPGGPPVLGHLFCLLCFHELRQGPLGEVAALITAVPSCVPGLCLWPPHRPPRLSRVRRALHRPGVRLARLRGRLEGGRLGGEG